MQPTIDFRDSSSSGPGDAGVIPSWTACCRTRVPSMFERRKFKCLVIAMLTFFTGGLVYLGYFCSDSVCGFSGGSVTQAYQSQLDAYLKGQVVHSSFDSRALLRDYNDFDVEGTEDVIVFLHIQKTGGTVFGRHLVNNIDLKTPCTCYKGRKKCDCENSKQHKWLFSRYSTGWRCGLHADWTELKNCVGDYLDKEEHHNSNRKYLYITILRDPYYRYLSEWKHTNRGATWLAAQLKCDGRQASLKEVPFCFSGDDWSGVSLDDFLSCPHNLANNRQTRMLANLSVVSCYNRTALAPAERDRLMLDSAKENLRQMAFFGLTEYQTDTQLLFEHTFHLNFIEDFVQQNATHAKKVDVTDAQNDKVLELNKLDIELYQFAKDLFHQRVQRLKDSPHFSERQRKGPVGVIDYEEEGDENYDNIDEDDKHSRKIHRSR